MATSIPPPEQTLPAYAELFCLSNFSFLQGASHAEELVARAVQLDYAGIAITDECSLAGVVRAHAEAKEAGLPLVIGSHFHLTNPDGSPALSLIALAKNREGYGNLCELITIARNRVAKGSYLITPADFAAPPPAFAHLKGLPDCLLILLPHYPAHQADDVDSLHAQAAWMEATFPGRAWMGLNLLQRAFDEAHRLSIDEVALQHRMRVVAVGHVCMHVRSRKPLHDTLTAVRIGKPVGECGYSLSQNAEQHLRPRLRLANLYPEQALLETLRIMQAVHIQSGRVALRVSARTGAAGPHANQLFAAGGVCGRAAALAWSRCFGQGAGSDREGTGTDRGAEIRTVLPDRVRHRAFRAFEGDPVPGQGIGGQLGGVLLPWRDRGGSGTQQYADGPLHLA
jgi:hypothetical protein